MSQNFKSVDVAKPLVSICCLVYNHEKFLKQTLDSFLMQQTSFKFEVVIHDDASTDSSADIIKAYEAKHPEIFKPIYQTENQKSKFKSGMNPRFNFSRSKGKYIAVCEGDDYWTDPLKLQKQVDFLEDNPNLIACHHWQKIAKLKNGKFVEEEAPKKGVGYFDFQVATVEHIFLNRLRLKSRTLMFRNINVTHDFLKFFNNVAYGDVPLSFVLGKYGDFGFINEEMAVYRLTGRGVSTAGLKLWGYNKFNIQHYKNWVYIWDKADTFYNYKYHKQASKTVNFFYKEMFKTMSIKPIRFFEILTYNSTRDISRLKTYKYIPGLFKLYIQLILKRVKQKFS